MLKIVYSKTCAPLCYVVVREANCEMLCGFKFESDALQYISHKLRDVNYHKAEVA